MATPEQMRDPNYTPTVEEALADPEGFVEAMTETRGVHRAHAGPRPGRALETKLFEVRDKFTLIVAMATKLVPGNEADLWLLRRGGYHPEPAAYVFLSTIAGGNERGTYDPYAWGIGTLTEAHLHILKEWDRLASGSVICTEYLRGERIEPKVSERLS